MVVVFSSLYGCDVKCWENIFLIVLRWPKILLCLVTFLPSLLYVPWAELLVVYSRPFAYLKTFPVLALVGSFDWHAGGSEPVLIAHDGTIPARIRLPARVLTPRSLVKQYLKIGLCIKVACKFYNASFYIFRNLKHNEVQKKEFLFYFINLLV